MSQGLSIKVSRRPRECIHSVYEESCCSVSEPPTINLITKMIKGNQVL